MKDLKIFHNQVCVCTATTNLICTKSRAEMRLNMTWNFAHRGFSGKYPENTMLAFEKAIEAGCDGIELDVQISKDGELVIIHDERLKRTTGNSGFVWEYTLKELKAMDASGKFGDTFGKNEIPTLREYFELVKDKEIITNVELKTGRNPYPGIEKRALSMIDEYGLRKRIWVSSFNHYSVVRFKELAPEIPCGLLEESWIVGMFEYAKSLGADFVHPTRYIVTEEFVHEAADQRIGINTWTVNEIEDIKRFMEWELHGIIGNYPDRALEVKKQIQV